MDSFTNAMDMNSGKLQDMVRGQRGLACCSPWGCKESDMTGQLNNNSKLKYQQKCLECLGNEKLANVLN